MDKMSLAGYSPRGTKSQTWMKWLSTHIHRWSQPVVTHNCWNWAIWIPLSISSSIHPTLLYINGVTRRKCAWKQTKTNQELGLPRWNSGEESANAEDARDAGRSPGEGNGNPLQYSCLENSMGRGAWPATVHGVAESQTRLSTRIHNQRLRNKSWLQALPWKMLRQGLAAVASTDNKSQGDGLGCKTAWSHCTFKLKNFLEALHFAILSYLF